MFDIKENIKLDSFYGDTLTEHFSNERVARNKVIATIGNGEVLKSFVVDTGHRNGLEIHQITNTGLIFIYNQNSKKLITVLIARHGQLKRYYDFINIRIPKWLNIIAMQHQRDNLNYV